MVEKWLYQHAGSSAGITGFPYRWLGWPEPFAGCQETAPLSLLTPPPRPRSHFALHALVPTHCIPDHVMHYFFLM
jgi:hypothetical protein